MHIPWLDKASMTIKKNPIIVAILAKKGKSSVCE